MILLLCSITFFFFLFFLILLFYGVAWLGGSLYFFNNLRVWGSPFECGFLSQGASECYFSCTYFILLVFFVVFDLEVCLLFNIPFEGELYKNFLFYYLFLVILIIGFTVEISGGYVSWSY
nr:NADH dehydrogenase subunit 3 [Haematoloechus sp. CW13H]